MEEKIIISLTSYAHRLTNLPAVLNTIYAQTVPPDLVVLNLAYNEVLPDKVKKYLEEHSVEVNRVPDTKVYKKIIPTLKKYPNDCIICIDDDFLYPEGMIEDFIEMHKKYPNNPISGTNYLCQRIMTLYHNGCAALVKFDYFNGQLDMIDEDLMKNCPSSDYVFTYFANKANHPYVKTKEIYHIKTMKQFNEGLAYTASFNGESGPKTLTYLEKRFGKIDNNFFKGYIDDGPIAEIIGIIYKEQQSRYDSIVNSKTYRFAQKLQRIIRIFK